MNDLECTVICQHEQTTCKTNPTYTLLYGMNEFKMTQQNEQMRQRTNVLFRNNIINREKLKAFRLYLLAQKQHTHAVVQSVAVSQLQQAEQNDIKHEQRKHIIPSPETKNILNAKSARDLGNKENADVKRLSQLTEKKLQNQQAQLLNNSLQQKNSQQISKKSDLEIKAARFAHLRQTIAPAYAAWKNKRNSDILFIKRENRQGTYFQTFSKDAINTSKAIGTQPWLLQMKRKKLQFISIPERKMTTVINELAKRDLEWGIINTKGQNVPLTRSRKSAPTLSANIAKPTIHNIDAVKSLNQNRQDSRRTSIHVESMSVTADNKGNWRVSGLVNGISVSAKAIERDDAVNYKKGIMSKEEMAEKYNLHVPPKQQTKVTRKNNMTRRYSLDNN